MIKIEGSYQIDKYIQELCIAKLVSTLTNDPSYKNCNKSQVCNVSRQFNYRRDVQLIIMS